MATTDSLFFKNASGHVGREFVFKQYEGKTVISKYPNMKKRVLSEKQLRINEIMHQANLFARRTLSDGILRDAAQTRLNVTRNKLYTSLIREYFKDTLQKPPDALDDYDQDVFEKFKEHGVSESDINELKTILLEKPDRENRKLGPRVNEWIGKMFGKVLNGETKVSPTLAGSFFTDWIWKYYFM
jgi:hypothetical protein